MSLKRAVYLSETMFDRLVTDGALTVGETTIEYSDDDFYFVPEERYPVGAIYMSITEINPAEKFGGIWEYLGQKYLLDIVGEQSVSVFGNGNALGLYDGEDISYLASRTDDGAYTKLSMSNRGGAFGQTLVSTNYRNTTLKSVGVVEDASKSGLTGSITLSGQAYHIYVRLPDETEVTE